MQANCLPNGLRSVHAPPRMALLGRFNTLPILREAAPGFYLDGGPTGEILLPGRYMPRTGKPLTEIEVFVYRDSEDRLVATTETPYVQVGEFACLRVIGLTPRIGVFLDWGLEKDLLLPIREQSGPLNLGDWVVVHVFIDPKTNRIIASARTNRHLNLKPAAYKEGQAVKILVTGESPLGYNAIVNHAHKGLLYHSDLSGPLGTGETLDGYVRAMREDGKIDLALDRAGYHRIAPLTQQILEALAAAGGRMPYHDGSTPEEIRIAFGVSKKAFKQAIGSLFRDRKILITDTAISLPAKPGKPLTAVPAKKKSS